MTSVVEMLSDDEIWHDLTENKARSPGTASAY